MSILTRLPYELLLSIFDDHLDSKSLLNLTLTNRHLNEPASWSLYRHIIVNPDEDQPDRPWTRQGFSWRHTGKVPFAAFRRRPKLRNAVQGVTIYSSLAALSREQFQTFVDEIASLHNLNTAEIYPGYLPRELVILLPVIFSHPRFSTLIISSASEVLKTLDHNLPRTVRIQTTFDGLQNLEDPKMHQNVTLLGPSASWTSWTIIRAHPTSLTSLHTLIISSRPSIAPNEICELISPMKRLTVLAFSCTCGQEMEFDGNCDPTGLKMMKDLRIGLAGMTLLTVSKLLEPLVRCIAGESRLERLDIKTLAAKVCRSGVFGTKFIYHILAVHAPSLRILKLPNLHLSVGIMRRVLSECIYLRKLWIGANSNLFPQLPEILPLSSSLMTLRVYRWGHWDHKDAQSLLCQDKCSLRELKACSSFPRGEFKMTVWKVIPVATLNSVSLNVTNG
ncbi:hypothetical protein CPB86DRAFT_787224 [Serendipita vermifera]|nr:hypothetical protein CPB86DRAFT_787224 [Serendipita vermifera]